MQLSLPSEVEGLPRRRALELAVKLDEEVLTKILLTHFGESAGTALHDMGHAINDFQNLPISFFFKNRFRLKWRC